MIKRVKPDLGPVICPTQWKCNPLPTRHPLPKREILSIGDRPPLHARAPHLDPPRWTPVVPPKRVPGDVVGHLWIEAVMMSLADGFAQ